MSRSLSSKLRFKILERDKFTCRYCGAKAPDVKLQIDHIYPVCLGGDNRESNLVTACVHCNNAKGAMHLDYLLSEEDINDFKENYRNIVRSYGYYTNYIKKVFTNNGIKETRPKINKFVERSFTDENEFYLFKKELYDPRNAFKIMRKCNIEKISYAEYREKEQSKEQSKEKTSDSKNLYEEILRISRENAMRKYENE